MSILSCPLLNQWKHTLIFDPHVGVLEPPSHDLSQFLHLPSKTAKGALFFFTSWSLVEILTLKYMMRVWTNMRSFCARVITLCNWNIQIWVVYAKAYSWEPTSKWDWIMCSNRNWFRSNGERQVYVFGNITRWMLLATYNSWISTLKPLKTLKWESSWYFNFWLNKTIPNPIQWPWAIHKARRVHDKPIIYLSTYLPTYLLICAFWTFLLHIGKHARSFNPLQGSRVRAIDSLPL
jgi:hypothetical protein